MQKRLRALLLTTLAVLPSIAVAQDQPDEALIWGRVTDARFAAIEKVTVTLRAVGVGEPVAMVQTKSDGTFTFPAFPPKAYQLRFERIGFVPVTMEADKAMALGVVVMQIGEAIEGRKVEARPSPRTIPPRAIKRVDPEYTARAKAAGLEVADPLGLDDAAVAAIETWRFKPSTRDDVPTPATVTIHMNFKLPVPSAVP
jgi:hypothetical protein